jgi:GDP-4-dehydro-6-deoxy-D-mannose reductase
MRLLITGASGFIGRYLSDFAVSQGHEVVGTYLTPEELRAPSHLPGQVRWERLDVRDKASVERLVASVRPEGVFHLAAQAYARKAWEDPIGTFEANVLGTIHLFEALRERPPSGGTFVASSASTYGVAPLPMTETTVLNPINPYGVSKASQDMLSLQYALNFGLRIVRGRLFITTGPGKTGDALNDFAQQVVALERAGGPGELKVGNLDTRRDISDVRDAVRAIWLVFERADPPDPVNIGAGASFSIRGIAEQLVALARVPIQIVPDHARFRPTDEPEIRGDISRLKALGYAPSYPLSRTVADVLEFWRGVDPEAASTSNGAGRTK